MVSFEQGSQFVSTLPNPGQSSEQGSEKHLIKKKNGGHSCVKHVNEPQLIVTNHSPQHTGHTEGSPPEKFAYMQGHTGQVLHNSKVKATSVQIDDEQIA